MHEQNLQERIDEFLCSGKFSASVTKFILAALMMGGVLVVGAMAPNIFKCFRKHGRSKKYSPHQVRNAVYALKRGRFIKVLKVKNGKACVKLTNKGRRRVKEFLINDIRISMPNRWDGKWRVVIFDIPVKYNNARESLRSKIKQLGFYQLQKSVWIHPYPCEDELLLIANLRGVERYIEILIVESLLHEQIIKKYFDL